MGAVEVIGDGAGVGFHERVPGGRHADRGSAGGERSQNTTAGEFHGGIGSRQRILARWGGSQGSERQAFSASFLDFSVISALNAATSSERASFRAADRP